MSLPLSVGSCTARARTSAGGATLSSRTATTRSCRAAPTPKGLRRENVKRDDVTRVMRSPNVKRDEERDEEKEQGDDQHEWSLCVLYEWVEGNRQHLNDNKHW